jgi:hypothetical protein
MKILLALTLLTVCPRAFAVDKFEKSADAPKTAAPPPKREGAVGIYAGDLAALTVVADGEGAVFYSDGGRGTAESPRHDYVLMKIPSKLAAKPVLIFRDPADGGVQSRPKGQVHVARKKFKPHRKDFGNPYQRFGNNEKGAWCVMTYSRGQENNRCVPMIWWGLPQEAGFEKLDEDAQEAAYDEHFPHKD